MSFMQTECYKMGLLSTKSNWKSSTSMFGSYEDPELIEKLIKVSSQSDKIRVHELLNVLTSTPLFYQNIWQKRPFLCKQVLPNLDQGYISDDLKKAVDEDFIEAGRGTFEEGRTGWNMKAVSTPKGKSFEEAKLKFDDIEKALKEKSGTVVINSAGGFIPVCFHISHL